MEKIDPKSIENILALTPLQEGMLFHYLQDPKNALYFEQLCLEVFGEINVSYFEKAWQTVIATNEMLRTVFRWEKLEKSSQIILRQHKCNLVFYDLTKKDSHQAKTVLAEIKRKDRCKRFDLSEVPFRVILCKLDEKKYEMIISNHHILYDGWSNGIILKEFFKAYHELGQGGELLKLPVKPSFKEFLKWTHNQAKNEQEKFWRAYLNGFETPTELPIKNKIIEETARVDDYSIILAEDTGRNLDIFVKNNHVTLATVFYAAWGILLQKYCGSEDVIFGTTVSGRSAGIKGIENIVGLFINTIPLRTQTTPHETLSDIVFRIDKILQSREEVEHTSLVDIRNYCNLGGNESLFDTIVVIENYPLDNRLLPENSLLSVHSYAITEMTHYDLTVGIMLFNQIEVKFSFHPGFFDKETIESLAGHYKGIIQNIIENPGTSLSQLEIISSVEKNRILYEFNNTAVQYPEYKSIHQLLAEQIAKIPDKIALISSLHHYMTYKSLNDAAGYLGRVLKNKGVGPNCIVGLLIERSLEMIIGVLGILKAGGAYLPIETDYPPERIGYMLENSQTRLFVTRTKFAGAFNFSGEIVNIENVGLTHIDKVKIIETEVTDYPQDIVYMIYTSGSTGKPKGVIIQKEGFLNLLRWYMEALDIRKEDNNLLIAPISFDLAQKNLFSPFLAGGRLTLASPGIPDYIELKKLIHKMHVTMINCAPSVFYPLVEPGDDSDFAQLHSLRAIILGGEPI
ncbi:MAG TPA: condensation domain-containing protein, partial [Candidatus Kapabacteria bacterium]|nr:condensation domain-containing protein [Candidatus Kapabacteria bacterium]